MNPSIDADELGWGTYEIEYGEPCYSFNTLTFWRTKGGLILMAHDSGCSCPTPFEEKEGDTEEEIIQKLERVGSLEQAKTEYLAHGGEEAKPDKSWGDLRAKLLAWGLKP